MRTKILDIEAISQPQRNRMFQIMSFYYNHVTREQFDQDLNEKSKVILLFDLKGQLCGFSTILVTDMQVDQQKVVAIYSGDTVLDRAHWGNGALGMAFSKYIMQVKRKNLFKPVYWFLISKGYKTYLLMANNFRTHYPRYEHETPVREKKIMDAFYSSKFGSLYHPEGNLIVPKGESCALKISVADIDENLLKHPRIAFFANRNPEWQKGQELACIAKVTMWIPVVYFSKRLRKIIFNAFAELREIVALPE